MKKKANIKKAFSNEAKTKYPIFIPLFVWLNFCRTVMIYLIFYYDKNKKIFFKNILRQRYMANTTIIDIRIDCFFWRNIKKSKSSLFF